MSSTIGDMNSASRFQNTCLFRGEVFVIPGLVVRFMHTFEADSEFNLAGVLKRTGSRLQRKHEDIVCYDVHSVGKLPIFEVVEQAFHRLISLKFLNGVM